MLADSFAPGCSNSSNTTLFTRFYVVRPGELGDEKVATIVGDGRRQMKLAELIRSIFTSTDPQMLVRE
jgi:hypothetical protein